MKQLLIPAFVFSGIFLQAQLVDHFPLQKEYPGENAVYLTRREAAEIRIEKGALKVYTENYDDMLLLTEKGALYNERSVYYSHFEEIRGLEAKTLLPDGKSYKTRKVTQFQQKDDVSSGVFYDDQKAINFNFTDLKPGARTVLSYTEVQSEPRFFGAFFFGSYIHSRECEFSVKVPDGVKVKYKLFHVPDGMVEFSERREGKYTLLSWKAKEVKKIESEDGSPNIRYYAPHVIIYITDYTVGKETRKLLGDVNDLYRWYRELTKDVNKEEDEHLRHVVDSLVGKDDDEYTKVKKVFYWVQDNIKYVAFEDGLGGFIPREAGQVCSRRYGDCKDMASIITTMLRYAGVKSYLTWIGSRHIPYTYSDVPTPLSDNHMIATWISKDGKYYFLDATGKNAPLWYHTAMIQGKEALIGLGPEECKVFTVPVFPMDSNLHVDSVSVKLRGLELIGKGYIVTRGYGKIDQGDLLKSRKEDDRQKYLKNFVSKGNNKFRCDSVAYRNVDDREKQLEIDYTFMLPDYVKVNGDEIYLNMNIDKTNKDRQMDLEKRKTPYEMDERWRDRFITTFTLPEGYEFSYIPPDARFEDPRFGFSMNYIKKGNTLTLYRDFHQEILLLQREDMVVWNKLAKELNKAFAETIIIRKKK